jgi:CRISPR-associated protein Cas2
MIVITLTDCPPALRGDLTKWFQQIDTGVYVGHASARVREEIWKRIRENAGSGRAIMVFSVNNEQRMDFHVHNASWEPIEFDGLKLMLRPSPERIKKLSEMRVGFSKASHMHRARQMAGKRHGRNSQPERYLVVDVETTGLSASEHEIIEIGALIVSDKQVEATFQSLIKPSCSVPPSIQALTGLSEDIIVSRGERLSMSFPVYFFRKRFACCIP